MIAKPAPATGVAFEPQGGGPVLHPTGWVYEICPRTAANSANQCPPGPLTASEYGGVRLAMQKGDALKIRLVNRLPKLDPIKVDRSVFPGGLNLPLNPTNWHTDGLDAPAREPTLADRSFGGNVAVEIYNSANGAPAQESVGMAHEMPKHDSIVKDYADYRIDIPANHPSGLFWFHPYVYGLTVNQLASGLSGVISVGEASDYARGDLTKAPFPADHVRHLILKDMQVLAGGNTQFSNGSAAVADGEVLNQQDPAFCAPNHADSAQLRRGSCPGADNVASGGANYQGGQWFFTVSGLQYPTIRMSNPDGEIWRIVNASGGVSYNLQLVDDAQTPMLMQLLSIDGAGVHAADGAGIEAGGAPIRPVPCPTAPAAGFDSAPVCVSALTIRPNSRAELWVTYRGRNGEAAVASAGAAAILKTVAAGGDSAPAVDLARVEFAQTGPRTLTSEALDVKADALSAHPPARFSGAPFP